MDWTEVIAFRSTSLGEIKMKKSLLIALMIILSFSFTACNRFNGGTTTTTTDGTDTQSVGKITLSYWNPLTGADGTVMRQLVSQFNAAHQGVIEVSETYTNEVDYYTNLNLLVPMGKGPDVAIMHSYLVQSYANSGIIVPIDAYIETSKVDINPADYITDVVESLYFENKLYGIPLDIHVVGIYYNKTLLNKYSLAVPTTRAQLIAAAKTVQAGELLEGKTVWGLPISSVWPSEWIFTTALYQNNGDEIDQDLNPAYDSVAGKTALRSVANLIHVEKISPLNLSVDQDLFYFQTGQALFHIQGSWMLNSIIESGVNFGVFPMSNMFNSDGAEYSNYIAARSHTFVIPKTTKTVSDAKKTAIMTFVKYLGDHSYIWAAAGQIPASNIARATSEYAALQYHPGFGNVEYFRVAERSPYYHEAYSPIYSRVTAALLNANYNEDTLFQAAVTEALQLIAEAKTR
jgi:multiple sugar transport system substrate-binding protein